MFKYFSRTSTSFLKRLSILLASALLVSLSTSIAIAGFIVYSPGDGVTNRFKTSVTTMGATNTSRIDAVVMRVLQRGKDLNKDAYTVYITNVANGIMGLIEKPLYKDSTEVRTIAQYIVWELESTQNKLAASNGFFDELMRIIEGASSTGSTVSVVGSGSTTQAVVGTAATNAVPAGSCYIDFNFFGAKNLRTSFGPGSTVADSEYWMLSNNAKKVGSNYYYLDTPFKSNGWWDKTTSVQTYFVTCTNGVLTGSSPDGSGQSIITAVAPASTISASESIAALATIKLNKDSLNAIGDTVVISWTVPNTNIPCNIYQSYMPAGWSIVNSFIAKNITGGTKLSWTVNAEITKVGSYSYGLLCDSNPDVNLTGPFGTGYQVGTSALTLKAPTVVANTASVASQNSEENNAQVFVNREPNFLTAGKSMTSRVSAYNTRKLEYKCDRTTVGSAAYTNMISDPSNWAEYILNEVVPSDPQGRMRVTTATYESLVASGLSGTYTCYWKATGTNGKITGIEDTFTVNPSVTSGVPTHTTPGGLVHTTKLVGPTTYSWAEEYCASIGMRMPSIGEIDSVRNFDPAYIGWAIWSTTSSTKFFPTQWVTMRAGLIGSTNSATSSIRWCTVTESECDDTIPKIGIKLYGLCVR